MMTIQTEPNAILGLESRMEQPPAPLTLADGVYVCIVDQHAVFLDLGRDNYSAIPLRSSASTRQLDESYVADMLAREFEPHRADLMSAGLVEEGGGSLERLAEFLSIIRATGHFLGRDDDRCFGFSTLRSNRPKVGVADAAAFYVACWKASRLIGGRHISKIAARVRRRKYRAHCEPHTDELRRQLLIFRRMRPWYPRSYVCLWDSLALLEFLAPRRLFPEWVFGVQVEPFGAHCWVQFRDKVLNDDTEYTQQFTPIMAI